MTAKEKKAIPEEAKSQTWGPGTPYETEEDLMLGVETIVYDNDNKAKRVPLSTGKIATVRELTGRDMVDIEALIDGNQKMVYPALIAKSTTIDGHPVIMEDTLNYKAKDYGLLKRITSTLNF